MLAFDVLIVEDEPFIGLALSVAAEDAGATIVGPALSVDEALALIDRRHIDCAILDAMLIGYEVTPVALRLLDRSIPFVLHTGTGLPVALAGVCPEAVVVMKPASPYTVVEALIAARDKHLNTDALSPT